MVDVWWTWGVEGTMWVLRGLRDGVVTTRWPAGPTPTPMAGAARPPPGAAPASAAGRRPLAGT